MSNELGTARLRVLAVVVGMLAIVPFPVLATTYNYTGPTYTTNTDSSIFGTNLAGTVTFDFDTSSYTGTVSGLVQITNLQLTSGTYTLTPPGLGSEDYFDFVNGAITHWDVGITQVVGTQGVQLGTCSPYGSSSTCFLQNYTNTDYPDAAFYVDQSNQHTLEAFSDTQENWVEAANATPLPSSWTMMLIGFAALGFVAYRRRTRPAYAIA